MNKQIIPLNRGMNKNGGAYFCRNIAPARDDGVLAGLSLLVKSVKTTDNSVTDYLGTIYGFAQTGSSSNLQSMAIFGKSSEGDIHLMNSVGTYICLVNDYSQTNSSSRGIITDQSGSIIYTGNRYIGKAFSTTLSAQLTASASTCDLTDASNFPTSGYALVKNATTTNSEIIQFTGKTDNQLTGVTRGKYYTTDRTHASGTTVYFFDDDWKDLGASITTSDWTAIACGGFHSLGISGNKLFAWGYNNYGQLGDNTNTNRHTPTQIGTSDWTAIACGDYHSLGIELVEVLPSSNFFLFFN